MLGSDEFFFDSPGVQHRENLRRDGLTPVAGKDRGAAGRIALVLAAIVGLAVLGSLPADQRQREAIESVASPGGAPQIVAVPPAR